MYTYTYIFIYPSIYILYISICHTYYNPVAAGPERATKKGRNFVCLIIKEMLPRALARGFEVAPKVPL